MGRALQLLMLQAVVDCSSRESLLCSLRAEEVRAIMMASARHNIEGSSQLSDKDGAGGILLGAADTVAASTLSDFYVNDGAASTSRSIVVSPLQPVRKSG
jgi:hypothetical protein